jgi:hypothetical protein
MCLTGSPDGIFLRADRSLVIVDYKTAKYTEGQDELRPMYVTQLNGYALIAERQYTGVVSGLALVYAEPITSDDAAIADGVHLTDGFRMSFSVRVVDVPLRVEMIHPLLERARKILDAVAAPKGTDGCRDCERLDGLVGLARD